MGELLMEYLKEVKRAMDWLGKQKNTIFLGQTVRYEGSPMYATLTGVPDRKKLEMPVAEEMQMGISIGLALEGFIPVSIYPRMDFLICAVNQLVNHLNHCEKMSRGEFKPGVIIRTMIGNTEPLYPGKQHCGDYTEGLKAMCDNILIRKLDVAEEIYKSYVEAYKYAQLGKSTILVEMPQGAINPNAYWEEK